MVKHNNVVPNGHFRKHQQNYVKTWFNQPAGKARRRLAQQKKAVKIFPRPTAAGIRKKLAPTIGIAVDLCRKNQSLEGLHANVRRLKTYRAKLVVFPRCARKFKAGDSTPEELANATQSPRNLPAHCKREASGGTCGGQDEMKSFNAYAKLRVERMNKRHMGARMKKAAEAEKEDK